MAEPSSGKEEQDESRSNSFTKFLRSPASEKSPRKKSSNPLTKLLRRRSARKQEEGDASSPEVFDSETIEEEEAEEQLKKHPSLAEEVKEAVEAVENAVHDLIHRKKKDTSLGHSSHARSKSSDDDDSSSESSKESKHDYLGKFKDGFGKAKKGLKEEYDKAKEELKTRLNKEKAKEEELHHHQQPLELKPKPEISAGKKPLVEDEVKAPNLVQRLQEEVVAVVSTIEENAKKGKPSEEKREEIKEEKKGEKIEEKKEEKIEEKKEEKTEEKTEVKKEDNCITSLAQGLQNLCSWGSKKED